MTVNPEGRKMFCSNCGTSLSDNVEFCSNCGFNIKTGQAPQARSQTLFTPPQPYGQPYLGAPLKSEVLSLILAFLIPGAGHLYVGRLTRGLVVLVVYYGISAIMIMTMFAAIPGLFTGDVMMDGSLEVSVLIAFIILSMIALVIWIVQLIDAYNLTKQYNDTVRRTGQPPW